jgi:hypothetical protein
MSYSSITTGYKIRLSVDRCLSFLQHNVMLERIWMRLNSPVLQVHGPSLPSQSFSMIFKHAQTSAITCSVIKCSAHVLVLILLNSKQKWTMLIFLFLGRIWTQGFSHLLSRRSTAWAMPPARPGSQHSHFSLPAIAMMIGVCHHAQLFSVEIGSHKLFCSEWPGLWSASSQPPK